MTALEDLDRAVIRACAEYAKTGDLAAPRRHYVAILFNGRRLKDGPFPEALARKVMVAMAAFDGVARVELRGFP